jgi:hypothetical protein
MGANLGIQTLMPKTTECIFCNLDRAFLTQTALSVAFLDTFPVSQGHTLVIPKRHIETIWEMTTEEYEDAFDLIRKVKGNGFSPQVRQPPMMLALAGTSAPRSRWGDEAKPPGLLQSLAALLIRSSLSHTWFSIGGGDGKAVSGPPAEAPDFSDLPGLLLFSLRFAVGEKECGRLSAGIERPAIDLIQERLASGHVVAQDIGSASEIGSRRAFVSPPSIAMSSGLWCGSRSSVVTCTCVAH